VGASAQPPLPSPGGGLWRGYSYRRYGHPSRPYRYAGRRGCEPRLPPPQEGRGAPGAASQRRRQGRKGEACLRRGGRKSEAGLSRPSGHQRGGPHLRHQEQAGRGEEQGELQGPAASSRPPPPSLHLGPSRRRRGRGNRWRWWRRRGGLAHGGCRRRRRRRRCRWFPFPIEAESIADKARHKRR
jgi:hypothetical protein